MMYGPTTHNEVVAAPAVAGLVLRSLGRRGNYAHYAHIFAAQNATHFFIAPQKRHIQPERCQTPLSSSPPLQVW
jgi:hypothetical protein